MNSDKQTIADSDTQLSNKYEFEKSVCRHNEDHRVRVLNFGKQFIQLFFCQLTFWKSLRNICLYLKVRKNKLYHRSM
jgi:hypothetical protein